MGHKFKLQSVLNYRQTLEDQSRQRLAEVQQRQTDMAACIIREQDSLRQLDQDLKARQQEGLSVAELQLYEDQIRHRQKTLVFLEQQLVDIEDELRMQREELLAASKDKKVMEKLKEKKAREYQLEANRLERNQLDEISIRRKGDSE